MVNNVEFSGNSVQKPLISKINNTVNFDERLEIPQLKTSGIFDDVFPKDKPQIKTTAYGKAEGSFNPETDSYSWYGGHGVSYTFGNTKVNGFISGKTTDSHDNGYMAEVVLDEKWPEAMQPFENASLYSNIRLRHNNCGSRNMQYRFIPVKVAGSLDVPCLPLDGFYAYPAYVTATDDLKGKNDGVKFGSLIGVSKKVDDKNFYFEFEANTNNERSSDTTFCLTAGVTF